MDFVISLLILVIIGLVVVIALQVRRKPEKEDKSLLMMQEQLNNLTNTVDNKLTEQSSQTSRVIKEVTERLTKLDETNKQVMGFAGQLQSLENILKNPKQRGVLGEYYLEELLKNVFSPSQYQLQYQFNDGETVDAVIFIGNDKIIPIDSKFSLENYNRVIEEQDPQKREELAKKVRNDLKNRIDETSKYIRPNEKTMEFAFMFIPAEAVYYDLLINKIGAIKSNTRSLVDYAVREKHVHIVSPTSFYAYLQTILQGLRAMQIEKSAKEIRKRVEILGRHIGNYEEYLKKIGKNLGATVNSYNSAYKSFGRIDKDVMKITDKKGNVKVKELDTPKTE